MLGTNDCKILRAWRSLAVTDIVYKAIAFARLTPLITLLGRLLIRRTGSTAIADADIALFFFATRTGALALLLVGALLVGVTALEQACLMTIVLGVDGLITNRPDVAREVLDNYARRTQAERPFLFVMTTLGVKPDVEPSASELRP